MNFSNEFFQHTVFEKTQIEQFLKKAKKNLEIAKDSKHNEVVLHFCYNSIIQLSISAIAEKGYKVRSIPGHHVKLLETMASLLDCRDEIDYLQKIRHKRNIDMYEGGPALTDKQASDLLAMTESLFKKYNANKRTGGTSGFTLVELIVSVAITAILMVGMATFFSSTFQNMFIAREKVTNTQGEFVVNTILGGKFVNTDKLQKLGAGGSYAVLRNDMETGDLPFTYIGKQEIDGADHIVFKDFFVFNGQDATYKSETTNISNPAGIIAGGLNNFYVTAPLENKIFNCGNFLASCDSTTSSLNVPGLNQPMDVDIDGIGTLFVADAGNNRILAIPNPTDPTPTVNEIATDLNYPTGLAYYFNIKTNKSYLFVADTYNHLVKRIDLSDNSIETVVGDGDDKDCNPTPGQPEHSAIFCKLRFPTDVMVSVDNKSLYIADTGNGRVLKAWDPEPDVSDYELKATLPSNTQISKIEFIFPAGTVLGAVSEGTPNTLHKGVYTVNGTTVTLTLSTTSLGDIMEDSYSHNVCTPQPQPPVEDPPLPPVPDLCIPYYHHIFKGFTPADTIFLAGDNLTINGAGYTATDSSVLVTPNPDNINTNSGSEPKYGPGAIVKVTKNFPTGTYSFYLNLTNATFLPGFNLIRTKIYDASDTLINDTDFQTLRVGDGELGTFEDTIEVINIAGETQFDFPTGIGEDGPTPTVSQTAQYSTDFPDYDYISDFEVESLNFNTPNPNEVLEMDFQAKLGEDAEGNDILQTNTLNANIKE